jgi:hypothetical protein
MITQQAKKWPHRIELLPPARQIPNLVLLSRRRAKALLRYRSPRSLRSLVRPSRKSHKPSTPETEIYLGILQGNLPRLGGEQSSIRIGHHPQKLPEREW